MANLATRVLRRLVQRGHAMLLSDIEREFPGAKHPDALRRAVDQLRHAKAITWTDQGWLATDLGRSWAAVNARLTWQPQRRAG